MAQLKSTSIIGNLSVTNKIVASEIIKSGGTASQLLLANGSVTTIADLLADTYPKFIQTKYQSEDKWYGKSYPIYAQWEASNICKWKVDNYYTKVDYANEATQAINDGNGDPITTTYVPLSGNKTITGTTTFDGPISTTANCLGNEGTNLEYLTGITSYDSGGYMKWQSVSDFIDKKGLATESWTNGQLANYYPLTGGYINGPIGSKDVFLSKPVADYRTMTNSVTGAITINLPTNIGATMVSMWIDVYNYSTNTSFSVHVGGYTYTTDNTWQHNPFAMVYGANHTVRLGHNGSNFVIYIGELNDTWAYPQISVRDVLIGYSQSAVNWKKDWSIGFTTDSFKGLVENKTTITNYAWTTKNFNPGNYLPLAGGTLTGTLRISAGSSSSWTEGIRIAPADNGWTTLCLGSTAASGTGSGVWSMHTYQGTFYLAHNGSSTGTPLLTGLANDGFAISGNLSVSDTLTATSSTVTHGTIMSDLTITQNVAALLTRTGDGWWTGIKSRTAGDEAVCFDAINPRTSWMFRTQDPRSNSTTWSEVVPSLHIKRQRVAINKLIADTADAAHYLDVNGDVGATAYVLSEKATIQYNSTTDCVELAW